MKHLSFKNINISAFPNAKAYGAMRGDRTYMITEESEGKFLVSTKDWSSSDNPAEFLNDSNEFKSLVEAEQACCDFDSKFFS